MTWKNGVLCALGVVLISAALLLSNRGIVFGEEQAGGGKGGAGGVGGMGGGRYSVVETQAHNLLVTDNATNTLYFYTVDKDEKVGADLKLRASIDLNQVGKASIKINAVK